jgi:hypothetical protein
VDIVDATSTVVFKVLAEGAAAWEGGTKYSSTPTPVKGDKRLFCYLATNSDHERVEISGNPRPMAYRIPNKPLVLPSNKFEKFPKDRSHYPIQIL